jgi:hypothetical protein
MISAVFLIFFLETNDSMYFADQRTFETMEECNLWAESEKERQQKLVQEGKNKPHRVIHTCINWGGDA